MDQEAQLALEAISKKLSGKPLTYKEIYAVMDQLSHKRMNQVLTTYFAASGYTTGFSNEEIYFLTKAMIETGEKLHFGGIVADKHSIGGVPGTRTSLIVVPIIASAGFKIPKSSSRAITTPGGTADDMEVLAPVAFNKDEIYQIVKKTNACLVWGGSVDIAPADDELIKVEEPILFESLDKILVSIMAKKIAFGSNHIVIDLPYGQFLKVKNHADATRLKHKFEYLASMFKVKIHVLAHQVDAPAGRGIGPVLETRDALEVLEQKPNRALDLEKHALDIASILLLLCLEDSNIDLKNRVHKEFKTTHAWAEYILNSGHALKKMREIIRAQGGNENIKSEDLRPGRFSFEIKARHNCEIKQINIKNAIIIARILGAPKNKKSGIYFNFKTGEFVKSGEILYTLYSEDEYALKEAEESLDNFPILYYQSHNMA